MYTHTKADHQFPACSQPRVAYFVCSTPRCGSSLLCEALCLSGLAGVPTEYFDNETQKMFCDQWGLSGRADYLPSLLNRKTSPNGVFGAKVHFHQYRETFGCEELPSFFPATKFIWISRRDKIRQAISYWRAIQTNQWASTHASSSSTPSYCFEEIQKLLDQTEFEQSEWNRFFERFQIEPLKIDYESFCLDIESYVEACLTFLGVPTDCLPPDLASRLTLRRQSDELSEDWVQRYQQDANG